ncbi:MULTISPECIES: HlyD family type I secretion periplasmic adaptor subunit [Halomonas]|uniref:Membrane fusion protein (MFP) family protein n=2 Tax=Halomonas TaxID=2745 RepID=A0AAU7KMV2_9GAMM|nr:MULTISPECIES: HlyD family type I secretion periplasmic adaptor subunit [Halomonas]MBR9772053.1 HlyD family type I secretion periplasmic adaptor subunit [Gammaproteobacteria bacterium]MAR70880.1 secretion protein HlyD [Halomonas sp.]MBR9879690.1 HlyD family type I secretion periplasmic adaptor subunit [Gammaproteobacteria bacterium]MBS8270018.1 HlyD family type I secretion periplasmic adaptor subunit [Halomonas litopenaei]MBY5942101.1 HlyD family type I secretion periplasmic adaptor subunit 
MNSPSPSQDDLPLQDTRYRRMGLIILLVAFGGFGSWSVMASLAVSVVAPGSVSVESFTKTVQHLEGGIVEQIHVEDGSQVEAGAPLITLDDTQAMAQSRIVETEYLIARASEVRLLAEQSGAETLVFPQALIDSDNARVQAVLEVQRRLFEVRRDSLEGTLAALDQQILQLEEQITGLEETQVITQRRIDSLNGDVANHRKLFRDGLISSQRMREMERESLEYQSDNARHVSEVARLRAQISENTLNKQIRLQEFQQQVGEALRQVQAEVADAEERLVALNDTLKRTQITAPVAGTVVGLKVHTLGAVVRGGDPLMDLVPMGDGFIVEAKVANHDVDHLYLGQPAEIRFSAFNQRLSNVIDGEVVHVSANSFEDEATRQRYYKVRIQVTELGEKDMTENMRLMAGMPAEVMIRTSERSFASYVAKPIVDMLARAMREE